MAKSKCPKCNSIEFEVIPAKPENSPFQLIFVQCTACGAVVGVLESNNINKRLDELFTFISEIKVSLAMLLAK